MKRVQTLSVIGLLIGGVMMVCGLITPMSTEAATFYVSTTGNNANPGTETQPFLTIDKGVDALKPGDTLYIKSGTYHEWLNNTIPGGTSWSTPVTVAAYPGDTVILQPKIGAEFVIKFLGSDTGSLGQYIIIDGLILDGTNVTYDAVKITYGSSNPPAHHIRIQNSEVRNAAKQGILVTTGSDNNEFINLDVHDNGDDDFEHGLYIKSKNNIIQDSRIYRNAGWGVHIYNNSHPGEADNNMVIKNKIYNNARMGDRGNGIVLGSGSGNKAYNNFLWGNNGGIHIDYNGSSNTEVYNNTIYGNKGTSGFCIYVGYGSKNDRVMNNICWENDSDVIDNGTTTVLGGNLTTHPLFVNASQQDFQLQEGSPGIDAGVTVNEVFEDFHGTSRPQGSKYDIGAYEYTGIEEGVDEDPPAPPKGLKFSELSN